MNHDPASDQKTFREGIPHGFTTLVTDDPARSARFYGAMGFHPHPRSGNGMQWYERRDRGVVVLAERSVLESFLGFDAGEAGAVMLSLDLDSRVEVDQIFGAGSAAGGAAKRMPDQTPLDGWPTPTGTSGRSDIIPDRHSIRMVDFGSLPMRRPDSVHRRS